jgi:hypothetical protein
MPGENSRIAVGLAIAPLDCLPLPPIPSSEFSNLAVPLLASYFTGLGDRVLKPLVSNLQRDRRIDFLVTGLNGEGWTAGSCG